MTNITAQTGIYAARKTFRAIGTDKAIAWLDQIMAAVAGTSSGESALTVLNRKLEASGVLIKGTSDPVFANETALFFYNTSSKTFFIRGSSIYEALIAEEDIIDAGTTTPVPNANTAWIVLRTDTPKRFFLKERTGSPGSYSYSLQGPFFAGSYQLRIILSAQDSPTTPSISWNWENANFNISGGDWATNTPNAKWWRIVECPNDSNTTRMTPLVRIGDPTAADITYTRPNRDGNLPSSVNSVQELGDAFHDYDPPTTTTTTTTSGNDEIQIGEFTSGWTYSSPLTGLSANTFTGYHSFTLNSNLRSLVTTYGTALSMAASAAFTTQAGSIGSITLSFGVANDSNNFFFSNNLTIESNNARTTGHVKTFGNLPADFSSGRLLVRVVSTSGTPVNVAAFFDSVKFRIEPDEDASSVPVDRSQFGDVLPSDDPSLDTAQSAFEFIDDLPLQVADTYDLSFEGPPNGIDDNSTWVVRRLPLERLLQIRNERPQQTFIAKIQYSSAYITGSRTPPANPPPDTVDFSHRVWSNLPDSISNSDLEARSYLFNQDLTRQTDTAVQRNVEVTIPNDCTEMAIGFKSNTGQNDARLLVTNYDFDIELGIDSSGFDGHLTDNIKSTQSLAQAVDDLTISAVSTAAATSVNNTQFSNPNYFAPGIRATNDETEYTVKNPTNVQQSLVNIDLRLSDSHNDYIQNQKLDHGAGTETFVINSGTAINSNTVTLDPALQRLGQPIFVKLRATVQAISSSPSFAGVIEIRPTGAGAAYGSHPVRYGTGTDQYETGDLLDFKATIPLSSGQVPSSFISRFRRNSGNTGSATFSNVFVNLTDGQIQQTGGMGSSESYRESIIWFAGPNTNDRYTGTNVDQTLLSGHRWNQYDFVQFNFDTTASGLIIKPILFTVNSFLSTEGATFGVLGHTDLYAILIRPTGTNTFRVLWNGGGSLGLRRILGINTARTSP